MVNRTILKNEYFWGFLLAISWWVLLNPGFFSVDSIDLLRRIESRNLSSEWTFVWEIAVFLLSFGGVFPGFATLTFALILNLSLAYTVKSVLPNQHSLLVCLLMFNCPAISFFGLTLWHDVPMTSGLLIFSSSWIRFWKAKEVNFTLQCLASLLIMFRHNGIWTTAILCIVGTCLFRKRICGFIRLFFIPVFVIGVMSIFLNAFFFKSENVQITGLSHWMKYDVACWLSKETNILERNDVLYKFQSEGNQQFQSKDSCFWFMKPQEVEAWSTISSRQAVQFWLKITIQEPWEILKIHAKRNAYLLPDPFNLPTRPPFLHTNVEYVNDHVKPTFTEMYEATRSIGRAWNYLGSITGYAGLWLLMIALTAARLKDFRPLLFLAVLLNSTMFVVAIIPDVRFVMYTIIVGYLSAVVSFLDLANKLLNILSIKRKQRSTVVSLDSR